MKGRVAQFSPDGKDFFVVLRKGVIVDDTNEYSIYLFHSSEAFHSPKPILLARMSSSSNEPAIKEVRWSNDGMYVLFIGTPPSGRSQIYRASVISRHMEKLTHHATPVVNYAPSANGHRILFMAEPVTHSKFVANDVSRTGVSITDQSLLSILKGIISRDPFNKELFVQAGSSERHIEIHQLLDGALLSLSPNGHYAVVAENLKIKDLPREWALYSYPGGAWAQSMFDSSDVSRVTPFTRYLLIDLETDSVTSLWRGAHWSVDPVSWTADGQWIFLKNVYLPLDMPGPISQEERLKRSFDIKIHPSDQRWAIVSKDEWPDSRTIPAPLDVELREDINTPPNIYVTDLRVKETSHLLDLNPQFKLLRLGRVETISWKVHGVDITGGLYLPPDYVAGKRYPLVIQTHGFDQNRFSMDGRNEWSSGFAARPLASKGIIVLQTYAFTNPSDHDRVGSDRSLGNTEQESFRTFAKLVYESAIDFLNQHGIIDRNRVGITGFSRTEWFVAYTLTHTNYPFRAAILTDGIDGGYFQYLALRATEFDLDNGGLPPFSEAGLKRWMKESPGFNLDRVRTPVRLVSLDTGEGILESWEWFSGLTLQKKPVDFVAIPGGIHLLQKPRDREIVMNGIVDWFSFWLLGQKDNDPDKVDQYRRWQALLKLDNENRTR